MDILYEDNHLLAVNKPGGLLVQGDRTGDRTALEIAKGYIRVAYAKPGNVFLALVHRVDRPVSGVVVFARTSKAASRLSREFRERRVDKVYLAVVEGTVGASTGVLEGFVERAHLRSRLVGGPSGRAKSACLAYRVIERKSGLTLVEVTPHTGRHHQIRVQLSGAGHPIVGDLKYGAREPLPDKTVALHSAVLGVSHPVRNEPVKFTARPPVGAEPWAVFHSTIEDYFDRRG